MAMDKRSTELRKEPTGKATTTGKVHVRRSGKIRKVDLCPFTQRLAAMLDAGLPLVQCMEALSEQTETPEFKAVVRDLGLRIEAGESFAEALAHYTDLFGELYVSMIRSGEMGGGLAEVAARLAGYLEASQAMARKIKSSMTYPVVVLCMAFILTTAMIMFIVPVFKNIFADFGAADKLPLPTQMLIALSDAVRAYSLIILPVLLAAIWLVVKWLHTKNGKYLFDRHVLRAPIAGQIIERVAIGRMSRTFASMLRSGVPILHCMEIVSQATGNQYLGRMLISAQHKVESGLPLAKSIQEGGAELHYKFPPMLIYMLAAGEKTGNVDGMLEKVADFYEAEVRASLEQLTSMIEPLLMAILGIVIGSIVISMFMPIFKMTEIVGG
ncbi:MAG: type II secretion system F family protein [Lentisphaeria bacterium]|jgi:type IV pilus assembly protein PilC